MLCTGIIYRTPWLRKCNTANQRLFVEYLLLDFVARLPFCSFEDVWLCARVLMKYITQLLKGSSLLILSLLFMISFDLSFREPHVLPWHHFIYLLIYFSSSYMDTFVDTFNRLQQTFTNELNSRFKRLPGTHSVHCLLRKVLELYLRHKFL